MKWSTWRQHVDNTCPIPAHFKVRCICRGDVSDEYKSYGTYVSAEDWDWYQDGTDKDIILYQYELEDIP